jgi:hypothetical protein
MQVHSHENFLKENVLDGIDQWNELGDHEKNRNHLRHFHHTYKELKREIYRQVDLKEVTGLGNNKGSELTV